MADKQLDYGSNLGGALFNTDDTYSGGEPLWAARSDWFIRFWGYVLKEIEAADTINPGSGNHLLYIDKDSGEISLRTGDDVKVIPRDLILEGTGLNIVDEEDGTITVNVSLAFGGLSDVTEDTPAENHIITRNGANDAWINQTVENILTEGNAVSLTLEADNTLTIAVSPAAAVADSTASDVAGIVSDFNDLLASLRSAGLLDT